MPTLATFLEFALTSDFVQQVCILVCTHVYRVNTCTLYEHMDIVREHVQLCRSVQKSTQEPSDDPDQPYALPNPQPLPTPPGRNLKCIFSFRFKKILFSFMNFETAPVPDIVLRPCEVFHFLSARNRYPLVCSC